MMLEKQYIDGIHRYNLFDPKWYCLKYPDVAQSLLAPLEHFIKYGIYENRIPNRNCKFNYEEDNKQNRILNYIIYHCENKIYQENICELANANLRNIFEKAIELYLFDYNWYLNQYKDVYIQHNLHPFEHYINIGWRENRNPSVNFDSKKYYDTYKEREKIGCCPLEHFIKSGIDIGLQYWPTEDYKFLSCTAEKKIIIVESPNDLATMQYRSKLVSEEACARGYKVIKINLNQFDNRYLVHDVYAIILIRTNKTNSYMNSLMNRAKNFKVPIIYDIDDYIWDESEIDNIRSFYKRTKTDRDNFIKSSRQVHNFLLNSDAIITSTWPLKKLAMKFGKPIQVIPNSINKNYVTLDRKYENKLKNNKSTKEQITIGYFSGTASHEYDFLECRDALYSILKKRNNVILKLVGKIPVAPSFFKNVTNQVVLLPLLPYEEMLSEISKCDIIVAPLEVGNIFCDCKSELKIFEAALFRVPVICSPTFTYASTIFDGINGFLAGNKLEWEKKLLVLIDNEKLRKEMGENAYNSILPNFEIHNIFSIYENFVLNIRNILCSSIQKTVFHAPMSGKSKNEPRISLVTCVYNKAQELPFFLNSIKEQSFNNCVEIIFVDDCSTDDSVSIIKNWIKYLDYSLFNDWLKPKLLKTNTNSGNCVGRNKGILAAKSDIVSVIDSDCIVSENYFQEHYNAHVTECGDVCIGSRGIETNGIIPQIINSRYAFDFSLAIKDSRHQDLFLITSFVNCVTRNFSFNKKRFPLFFDNDFSYTLEKNSGFGWEDVDFGCRIYMSGARITYLERCYTLHLTHKSLCEDKEKAFKSLINFYKLISKNKFLLDTEFGWVITTFYAIRNWLLKYGYDINKIKEYIYINEICGKKVSSPLFRKKEKRLRILSHAWHASHQYELCKLQHDFYYAYEDKPNWDSRCRPIPGNLSFVSLRDVDPNEYDLIIGHFDENILHPEFCHGVIPKNWGNTFLKLIEMRDKIPVICVCHGTPQFFGQYDIYYRPDSRINIIEDSRTEIVSLLDSIPIVVNSHQAYHEWNFLNSITIWHGFQPSEFIPHLKKSIWLCMKEQKMRQRPIYNGFELFKQCMLQAPDNFILHDSYIDHTAIHFNSDIDNLLWSKVIFSQYKKYIASHFFYLNFTQRSPMPRTRGECMMSGVIPVTTRNHDAEMFIKNGENGFLFDTAEEFADIMKYILANEKKWEKWSREARKTAISNFHIDRYLSEWNNLIKRTIQ